ncbi:nucleotidyltransferase domain-containing protein [Vibrio aestuarianus]|uniref:Nucleotidyltransferase n=1 Tax=Vibrio aestuarianus TaxID=28171 RepID=A0ABN8TML9_9VIBR|nr:nucleotidyltransferase [Vibrio aestuarianus]MDE1229123.1 nucleotidyltransferase [Vibrio aestuarianus]MDE1255146.1 nucleotidyltransferase [Vibrio aestuarianus]MDE1273329.1 nucleotidyltransferase [Vibrio aestuarianus]MDE1294808.1 nucleotidyltransferase [Vibrio aestuarianus]MDE1308885.1 nucleotidyltransferase [Vibrio aestuarianus]
MPRSLNQGFSDFLTKLTPSSVESQAAKSHRASIESCLKANYSMTRFFRTGSFGNGTSICGYSDVDYFAEIPTKNLKQDSNSTLSLLKGVLDKRFPRTGVKVSCPTVVVPFGTTKSESTEIAPCDRVTYYKTYPVYEIADGSGGWLRSCPDIHNSYVREVDQKHGGKVKSLIRFIKAWKYYNNVPISSFYLELQVTKFCDSESSIVYHYDIHTVLNSLLGSNLAKMRDPMGVSGLISPCDSDAKWNEAMSKLRTAVTRANNAKVAASDNKIQDAFYWYNMLFDNKFPNYY